MVKDDSWATLFDYQQGVFYMHHPTDTIVHRPTTAFFYTGRGTLTETRNNC